MKHIAQFTMQLHVSHTALRRSMQTQIIEVKWYRPLRTRCQITISCFSLEDAPIIQIEGITYSKKLVIRKPQNIAESFNRLHQLLMPSKWHSLPTVLKQACLIWCSPYCSITYKIHIGFSIMNLNRDAVYPLQACHLYMWEPFVHLLHLSFSLPFSLFFHSEVFSHLWTL